MSKAGKAYLSIDLNHGWVGGRKQLITGYDKSETELNLQISAFVFRNLSIEKLSRLTEMRNCSVEA